MTRRIFTVYATVVDANGTYSQLSGYPKSFDSKNYSNDIEKTRRRAEGDMSDVWGDMCKRDDRKMQTVWLMAENGVQLDMRSWGSLVDPDPEPEPEPEPEGEPQGEEP